MEHVSRRTFIKTASATAAAAAISRGAAAQNRKPNVLYIMTDQQRTDTLGCYGNAKAVTPSLDGLAARGTLFTSCYATQPVCTPCRSSMATGLFPNQTGCVENNIHLSPSLFAWPRALRDAGYATGYIGKWHLGDDPVPAYFDRWQGFHTGGGHWLEEEFVFQKPGESKADFQARKASGDRSTAADSQYAGAYRPDMETDHAVAFIRDHGDRPFALWLSYYPPHGPKTVPEEDIPLHAGTYDNEEQDIYHAMVHRLDKNIGRVLSTLDELGLRNDTIVVFASDHGENYPHRWNDHEKRLCYDQSANVPFIISWPGRIPEGQRIDRVFSFADFVPTLLDYTEIDGPGNLPGMSARRLIDGDATGWHEDIFVQNSPYRADAKPKNGLDRAAVRERCVVTDQWKFILNTHRAPELYRRHEGAPDVYNRFHAPELKDTVKDLAARLAAWGKKTDDELTATLLAQWAESWA